MKFKTFALVAATFSALSITAAIPAFAGDNYAANNGSSHAVASDRKIEITPSTRYVNVTHGEVITFVVGEKSFTLSFDDSSNVNAIDLQQAAPSGMLDHAVTIYVRKNPYMDGA
jgi:hypothetical protein